MRLAMDLSDGVRALARAGIKARQPHYGEAELDDALNRRCSAIRCFAQPGRAIHCSIHERPTGPSGAVGRARRAPRMGRHSRWAETDPSIGNEDWARRSLNGKTLLTYRSRPLTRADATFDALGNATRRSILRLLAKGPLPVGALANRLPVSRPAVSQHLRVLEGARLVRSKVNGRQTMVSLDKTGLMNAATWMSTLWPEALDRFKALAEETWNER
jgi:DNA-binding transcriptional ArsR family regulator